MPQAVTEMTGDALKQNWERFLKKYYKPDINEAALHAPAASSVEVDYWKLDRHDQELAEFTLQRPSKSLKAARDALDTIDTPVEITASLHVRMVNLPDTSRVEVRDLRSEHMGRLIAVQGLVKKATEVRPRVEEGVFMCLRCFATIRQPQEEHLVLKEPAECYEDQGGCGRSTSFRLLTEESRLVDTQKLEIQESPEKMRGGEQPQRLTIFAEGELCGVVSPGDRIMVNGVLRSAVRRSGGTKSTIFDLFLETLSIEMEEQEFDEVEITPEEEEEIRRFSRDPEIYEKIRESIAPSIYGMDVEKQALMLQLFGGVAKHLPDGSRLRGDIHILMVGDPGVAKSQLLRYAARLAPRGIYTSGKSSSAAGLTAAAVRDEFGDGRWSLEAGALVLADKGIACIDEIDKMEKNDRSSMHEAMEQQSISIAKAGITATLQSRCAILGAANPKFGRFEPFTPMPEQIDLPPALMSRFDVIFALTDNPEPDRDSLLANHILQVHRGGALNEQRNHDPESSISDEDIDDALVKVEPPVPGEFLRKYVAYTKRTCFPVMTDEARERIQDYYVDLRRQASGEEDSPVPLTARQLESFVRLAEASAKVRISQEVQIEDAERAINIVEYYLSKIAGDEGGLFDIDLVTSGVGHNQRERTMTVKRIVRELGAGSSDGAHLEEILDACEAEGMDLDEARGILQQLKERGDIYSPRPEHFALVRG